MSVSFSKDMGAQFIRYFIVGVVNTGLDFSMYAGLTRTWGWWRQHYLLANAVTFITIVTWSFFWNKYWTFKERSQRHATQYSKFVIVTLVGMGIAQCVLYVGVHVFSLLDLWSKVIASPLVMVWNFLAYRFWAFRSMPAVKPDETPSPLV
ncbi:MAG: GtrA family protein [bacterium]|nr:GtrA family protein [bacterium]